MEGPRLEGATVRENGLWRGWSPGLKWDRPGKRPLAWIVPGLERRPSGKTAAGVDSGWFQVGTIHIGAPNPGRSEDKDDFGKQNKPILFTNVEKLKARKQNRPILFTDTGLGVTTLPIFTETAIKNARFCT